MIITKRKALTFCTIPEAVKAVPSLLSIFEEYRKQVELSKKPGCSSCQKNKSFYALETAALEAICALGGEDLQKLKKSLSIKEELFAYSSGPTGVKLIKLSDSSDD